MRLKLIGCEVLYRELCAAVARSPHQVDIEFLNKGLHDLGSKTMVARLQAAVDAVDGARYETILLGYGLCGNGVVGLEARGLPIVLPRAHDCITLFLGDKDRYLDYFQKHPGVYFMTTGWVERGEDATIKPQLSLQQGFQATREELVARYGEDNADFLREEFTRYQVQYRQFTFIEMGLEPDDRFERCAIEEAARRGWKYEKVQGSMSLIEALVNGEWDERRFLVVPPGHRIVARYDEHIIAAEKVES